MLAQMGWKQLKAIAEKSLTDNHLAFKSVHVCWLPGSSAVCVANYGGHSTTRSRHKVMGPPVTAAKIPAEANGLAVRRGLLPSTGFEASEDYLWKKTGSVPFN